MLQRNLVSPGNPHQSEELRRQWLVPLVSTRDIGPTTISQEASKVQFTGDLHWQGGLSSDSQSC